MTTQEAYEMMRIYLGRPGARRAVGKGGLCRYETKIEGETHRCAVGLLFSPEGLSEVVSIDSDAAAMAGCSAGPWAVRMFSGNINALFDAGFELRDIQGVNRDFLAEAQTIHDCPSNWAEGRIVEMLDDLADRFRLNVVVDESKPEGAPLPERELVTV